MICAEDNGDDIAMALFPNAPLRQNENQEARRPRGSVTKWWIDLSLSVKTMLMQIVLTIVPLVLCIILLFHYINSDILINAAQISYNYCRNAVNSFEAEMLQVKATANVMSGHQVIEEFLAQPDENAVSSGEAAHILRGLTGKNIVEVVLYATENAGAFARQSLPLWSLEQRGLPTGWSYVYNEANQLYDVYWNQPIRHNEAVAGVVSLGLQRNLLGNMAQDIARISGESCQVRTSAGEVLFDTASGSASAGPVAVSDVSEGYHTSASGRFTNVLNCSAMNLSFIGQGTINASSDLFTARQNYLIILFVLVLVLSVIGTWLNYVGITRRIKRLSSLINQQSRLIEKGYKLADQQDIEIGGNDEIGQLARNFSNLRHLLVVSAERERSLELLQQTAKFSALQAQIQPHFLYNTLETLRMMAYENDDSEVADMLFTLGKLMRSSISGKKQETTLKEELDNIENYLKLNKLRFESLNYEIICDADISNVICPRFILQPIVENSIHHGVSGIRENRRVWIHIFNRDDALIAEVGDNGVGIPPERLASIRAALANGTALEQQQGGIGLMNVHSRLGMFFGGNSRLEIESEPGKQTLCRIIICGIRG